MSSVWTDTADAGSPCSSAKTFSLQEGIRLSEGRSLIREGRTVTIAEAAEAADVSLATAYRSFSSPRELLQETQLLVRAPDFTADLPAGPAERLDTLISRVAEPGIPTRNQTRLGYTRTALEPLADTLPPELHRPLTMAVTLVYGVEALIATRDACGLDPEEARDVMRWAASALLEKAVREASDA